MKGNHSLLRTTDVLDSGGIPELHNEVQRLTGLGLSFQVNLDSTLAKKMDERGYGERRCDSN